MGFVDSFRQLPLGRKALFFVSAAFLALYFSLGIIFLFVKNLPFEMSPALKIGFGIILIAYSIFRLARLVGSLNDDTE